MDVNDASINAGLSTYRLANDKMKAGDFKQESPAFTNSNASSELKDLSRDKIQSAESVSVAKLGELVDKTNDKLTQSGSKIFFELNQDTEKPVLTIKDAQTGDVIRQIPSESHIKLSKMINEFLDRGSESLSSTNSMPVGLITSETA